MFNCLISAVLINYLFQAAGYKEDFEHERREREKMHTELTSQLITCQGIACESQQKMIQSIHDKECETQALKIAHQKEIEVLQNQISTLQEQKSTVKEVASKLTEEDRVKNLEEEKLVLTSQVNAYSRQYGELKKTFEE